MAKKALLTVTLAASALSAIAQTTYLPLNTVDYDILDRLETRSGTLSNDLFLSSKPVMRRGAVKFLENLRLNAREYDLSAIDRYNMTRTISISGEWAEGGDGALNSKTPWFKTFYKKQPDFIHVNTDNFFMVVNPVISL